LPGVVLISSDPAPAALTLFGSADKLDLSRFG
jgi:hypothetical protein